jgi:CBS domain-containing protein
MKIKEISTPDPQWISPNASLTEAAKKMRILDIGMLPVCENDRLIGTVTDRDITVRAVAEGLDPKTVKVRQMMTQEVVFCFENRSVEEAAQLMEEKKIRRLPVLDAQRHLVGIVSIGDLAARAHEQKLAGQVLERVAERPRVAR